MDKQMNKAQCHEQCQETIVLINKVKSRGPKIEPYGTHLVTFIKVD